MRSFFFLAMAAMILGGLFLLFKPARLGEESGIVAPAPGQPAATAATTQPPTSPVASAPSRPRDYDFVVEGGKLVSGDPVVKVAQGDEVALRITSDKADEVHLHGYDRHAHVDAGGIATLRLKADRSGRFPFELHKSRLELGTLEVYPRQ